MTELSHTRSYHTTSTRIAASAGTGKTYQLASRYIALLMLHVEPESIIALTFTKKAAGEFRSRILHALAEGACDVKDEKTGRNKTAARVWDAWSGCAQGPDKKLVSSANDIPLLPATRPVVKRAAAEGMYPEELYKQDKELRDYLLLPETTAETFRTLLAKTVKVLDKLELATIDSFFNTLVTSSCMELGVDAISAIDPADESQARRGAIADYLEPRTVDAAKREDFLRMFADLTKGEGCRTIPKLEENLEEYLSLYHEHPEGSAWGNTAYFEEQQGAEACRALTDDEAAQWTAYIAKLQARLARHSSDEFPNNVFSGLKKLAEQNPDVTDSMNTWLDNGIDYRIMPEFIKRADELLKAFETPDGTADNLDAFRQLASHAVLPTQAHRNGLNDLVEQLGNGKRKKQANVRRLREYITALAQKPETHWEDLAVMHEVARFLRDNVLAKWIYDAKCRTRSLYSLLRDYADTYEQRIMTTGEFSFADMARKASELMTRLTVDADEKGSYYCREHLALRTGRKYQHWMLDEFQDTSDDQFKTLVPVLECLAFAAVEGETAFTQDSPQPLPASLRPYHKDATYHVADGSIFVVGDDKQGIYGFRTGETQAFSMLAEKEPWSSAIKNASLNKSFRSSPAIMGRDGFVNELFFALNNVEDNDTKDNDTEDNDTKDKDTKGNAVKLDSFTHHETTVGASGYVELQVLRASADTDDDDAPDDEYVEIGKVLERLTIDGKTPRKNISIAVLTRSNREAEGVVDYLRDAMPELPVLLVKDTQAATACPLGEMMHHFFRWLLHPQEEFSAALVRASFMGGLVAERKSAAAAWKHWREYLDDNGYAATVKSLLAGLSSDLLQENREVCATWLSAARDFDAAGGTLKAWVRRIDTLSTQGVASSRYVQVMTMHKSKGLEFDAVILPFMAKAAIDAEKDLTCFCAPDASSLLLRPFKVSDCVQYWPGVFTDVVSHWKQNASRQAYNLLYVATTRAKYANYILLHGAMITDDLKAKRSLGGLIRRALGESEEKCEETYRVDRHWGDENWLDSIEDKGADDDSPANASAQLGASVPRRARVSPSRLADGGEAAAVKWRKGNSGGRDGAAHLGTELHALMERVEWWEPGQPIPIPDDGSKAAKLARAVFDVPQVAAIFHRTPGAVAYNEQHVESLWEHGGEVWTSGTIDRLVLTYEGDKVVSAHIYDYKTNVRDRNADEQAQDAALKAEYKGQMEAYRDLMMAAFDLPADAVQATLVSCPSNGDEPRLIPAL